MSRKRKLLYIRWIDAASPTDAGWQSDIDIEEFAKTPYEIEDVGFVFSEDKHYITLIGGHSMPDEAFEGACHRVMKIPKAVIRKKVDLTRYIR